MVVKLNKHFQMCEMDYLPLLHVKTFISRSLDLNKIKWMRKKGIACMREAGKTYKRSRLTK